MTCATAITNIAHIVANAMTQRHHSASLLGSAISEPHATAARRVIDGPGRREAAGGVNRYCLFLVAGGGVGRIFAKGLSFLRQESF